MRFFSSLIFTLLIFVNFIDCSRVRQLPPSGKLPGHPDCTFFTVLPEDIRDVCVNRDDVSIVPVEEPLLAVAKNDEIIGWMNGLDFRPIFNEDGQTITISIASGRTHVVDTENQYTRERSRTPPFFMRNTQGHSGASPNHNIMMRDRTETPPNDDAFIRERSRTPRDHKTAYQGPPAALPSRITPDLNNATRNLNLTPNSNYATYSRDRSRTPQQKEGPNPQRSRISKNYDELIRERSRSHEKHSSHGDKQSNI